MEQLLHMTDVENQEVQADTIRVDLIQAVALIKDRGWGEVARRGATGGEVRQGATGRRKGAAWSAELRRVSWGFSPPPSEATAAPPASGGCNSGARLRGNGAVKSVIVAMAR